MAGVLYDQDFLDSNCLPDLFDETFQVDDTFGTYVTNFAIGLACLFLVLRILPDDSRSYLLKKFFALTGAGYFIAGIGHFVIETTLDPWKKPIEQISYAFVSAGFVFLLYYGLQVVKASRITAFIVMSVSIAVAVYSILAYSLTLVGVSQIVICVFAIVVLVLARDLAFFGGKIIGIIGMVAGMLVQLFLAPMCGDAGYEKCFMKCPLPNPAVFNHNALFHVIFMVGQVLLGYAESKNPGTDASYTPV